MTRRLTDPERRPYLVAAIIVLVGLCSAVVIFLTAGSPAGTLPEFSPEYSKKYLHDLELYGGRGNVMAAELMDWFDSLWHGRRLAYTVFALALLVSLGYLFFAAYLPPIPDAESDEAAWRFDPSVGGRPGKRVHRPRVVPPDDHDRS